jgi:hypothetical protein
MPVINVDTSGAVEPTVVAAGTEVELRIVDVKVANDKNGHLYMMPRFEVVGEPYSKEFTKFLGMPHAEMDAKKKNQTLSALQAFERCFGCNLQQDDTDQIVGLTGWAILGVEETPEYGEQNYVKKFIVGR